MRSTAAPFEIRVSGEDYQMTGTLGDGTTVELIAFGGVGYQRYGEGEWSSFQDVGPPALYDNGTLCPLLQEGEGGEGSARTVTGFSYLGEVTLGDTLTRHYAAPSTASDETWEIWVDPRGQLVQAHVTQRTPNVIVDARWEYSGIGEPNVIEPPRLPTLPAGTCSNGVVVPDPSNNSGLVGDCEILLRIQNAHAGLSGVYWGTGTLISAWDGVTVSGTPGRVQKLNGSYRGLAGNIPPDLGGLTRLEELDLSKNQLTGTIPPELAGLTRLLWLYLASNELTGCLPAVWQDVERSDLHLLGLPYCAPGGS